MEPFNLKGTVMIIGVCGGSGSGKTTFARLLHDYFIQLGYSDCAILGQDNYYIDQSSRFDGDGGSVNFDHPDSIDFDLMSVHLKLLKEQKSVEVPIYDFATHSRLKETIPFQSSAVIIVDGTLILSQDCVRQHFTSSVFLDIAEDVRFQRRLKRDVEERGRVPEGVRRQFQNQVKPMHDQFVQPSQIWAKWEINDNNLAQECMEKLYRSLCP